PTAPVPIGFAAVDQFGAAARALRVNWRVPSLRPTHTRFGSVWTLAMARTRGGKVPILTKLSPRSVLRKTFVPGEKPTFKEVATKTLLRLFGSMIIRPALGGGVATPGQLAPPSVVRIYPPLEHP